MSLEVRRHPSRGPDDLQSTHPYDDPPRVRARDFGLESSAVGRFSNPLSARTGGSLDLFRQVGVVRACAHSAVIRSQPRVWLRRGFRSGRDPSPKTSRAGKESGGIASLPPPDADLSASALSAGFTSAERVPAERVLAVRVPSSSFSRCPSRVASSRRSFRLEREGESDESGASRLK